MSWHLKRTITIQKQNTIKLELIIDRGTTGTRYTTTWNTFIEILRLK